MKTFKLKKDITALRAHIKNVNDQIYDGRAELEELHDELLEMECELLALADRSQHERLQQLEEAK